MSFPHSSGLRHMIRKLDLFLSNHSRFPAKQILMKASALRRDKEAKPRKNRVEEAQLSEREIQNLFHYCCLQGTRSPSMSLRVSGHRGRDFNLYTNGGGT